MVWINSGPAGFAHAPVSQAIVLASATTTAASWYLRPEQFVSVVPKLWSAQLGCKPGVQTFLCLSLLYNFRILERREGSGKFIVFGALVSTMVASTRWIAGRFVRHAWASGPLALTGALVCPVLWDIAPIKPVTLFGFRLTEKHLALLAAAQLACVGGVSTAMPMCSGFLAGLLYTSNALFMRHLGMPQLARKCWRWMLVHVLKAHPGPTRRGASNPPGAAPPVPPGFGGGAGPSRRHAVPVQVSAGNVQRIVDMGFSEAEARRALQSAHDDLQRAIGELVGGS